MANNNIFYGGNTVVWQEDCKPWAEAVLDACAIAIASMPCGLTKGNIELDQQIYGRKKEGIFMAELKGGKSSYWIMKYKPDSREIVSEALQGLSSLNRDENHGIPWTRGIFAEQISARLDNPHEKANLPLSGVYHYGDFVAVAMNGDNRRFMTSVSFACYAPQRIREHDLVLCAIATALSQIFGDDDAELMRSYGVVMEDLTNYAKLMHWSQTEVTKMATRIREEFDRPRASAITAWKAGFPGNALPT